MLEDRATLTRFREGDRPTLAAVYEHYGPGVFKLARLGFSFSSAGEVHRFYGYQQAFEQQDLVQEVFIRAFSERARMSYDGITPFEAYLRGVAKNFVIDEARKRRAALKAFGGPGAAVEDPDTAQADVESPEAEVQRERVRDAMKGFVNTLPVREQRFVKLRYEEGLGQEAVAKRMKVGRSTVRTFENRVRKRLHKHLRKHGVLEGRGGASLAATAPALLGVAVHAAEVCRG
jgi:RNA polymerase sigma-70 factor (ECF subfamily)